MSMCSYPTFSPLVVAISMRTLGIVLGTLSGLNSNKSVAAKFALMFLVIERFLFGRSIERCETSARHVGCVCQEEFRKYFSIIEKKKKKKTKTVLKTEIYDLESFMQPKVIADRYPRLHNNLSFNPGIKDMAFL